MSPAQPGIIITIKLNVNEWIRHKSNKLQGHKYGDLQRLYTAFIYFIIPLAYPKEHLIDVKVRSSFLPNEALYQVNEKIQHSHDESSLSMLEICSLGQTLVDEQIHICIESNLDRRDSENADHAEEKSSNKGRSGNDTHSETDQVAIVKQLIIII